MRSPIKPSGRTVQRFEAAAHLVSETLSPRELIVVTAFLRNLARLARVGRGLVGDYMDAIEGSIHYRADGRMERHYFSTETVQARPWRKNSFAVRYPEAARRLAKEYEERKRGRK